MRAALWLMSLFAVAVATALLASNNIGTVAIFWTPYRVDVSLNLVLFALVMILLTLHWAQRALTDKTPPGTFRPAALSKRLAKNVSAKGTGAAW